MMAILQKYGEMLLRNYRDDVFPEARLNEAVCRVLVEKLWVADYTMVKIDHSPARQVRG